VDAGTDRGRLKADQRHRAAVPEAVAVDVDAEVVVDLTAQSGIGSIRLRFDEDELAQWVAGERGRRRSLVEGGLEGALQRSEASLERRVAERTTELEEANARLRQNEREDGKDLMLHCPASRTFSRVRGTCSGRISPMC